MDDLSEASVCSEASELIWTAAAAQQLQMAARKSLGTMSGMILNRVQPKFAAK